MSGWNELIHRQTGVTVKKIVAQDKLDCRFDAVGAVQWNIQLSCNLLTLVKVHTYFLTAQKIRIFFDHPLCHCSPSFPDADGRGRIDSKLGEKQHDGAHPKHPSQLFFELLTFGRGNSLNLRQAFRFFFQYGQGIITELGDHAGCQHRADSFDGTGRKIAQNRGGRGREFLLGGNRFKLGSIAWMGAEIAVQGQDFSFSDRSKFPDHRDQFPVLIQL